MDIKDKDQFICWMQRALDQSDQSHTDDNYIELYNILLRWGQTDLSWIVKLYLRSFTAADTDYDGQVSFEEFHHMIEAAGALPR